MVSQTLSRDKENEIVGRQNGKIYIKKVILENFLSFQKDEVDFGEAKFVIIVGPNWSGKTSIFQAIKFALGSNERDDRYNKWSDFIRNGQNHAMVEIHIQNGEDVIKMRRFVIRGQSPFFMLKTNNEREFHKIQASEIQKITSDLSINPDNQFAFVSQGKIDAIKSLKPTELCSFLEEGIGLKSLRDEILNQKRNVFTLDNDLKSLISRRNTLNVSLDLLNPKLKRLDQKNKLLDIKKKYNDELLWANRDKLEKDLNQIDELIKNVKLVIVGIKKRKEKYDAEVVDLINKISFEEQNINKLSKTLGELDYEKTDLIAKIQNWQKEKILAKQELDVLFNKVKEIEKIINNFEKQKEGLESELRIIKQEHKEL
ncbi:MAG: AAA family ATPase, partial [Candidatus Thorarchaeota archaeon]